MNLNVWYLWHTLFRGLCVKNKDLCGVWKWIKFNLNKLLWATQGGKRGMKRIMSRKCHPHGAEMILNAFQMSPTWRWDMKKQAEPRLHVILMMGFFYPFADCVFFSVTYNIGKKWRATHPFFWCCCLGLHILATHDVITLFTEMANLPSLTIDNYGIIISFVLQREPSRQAVIDLGAQQEVAGRLQP